MSAPRTEAGKRLLETYFGREDDLAGGGIEALVLAIEAEAATTVSVDLREMLEAAINDLPHHDPDGWKHWVKPAGPDFLYAPGVLAAIRLNLEAEAALRAAPEPRLDAERLADTLLAAGATFPVPAHGSNRDALIAAIRGAAPEPGSVAAEMPDEAAANSAAFHAAIERAQARRAAPERHECWFCKGEFPTEALIAGYDTFEEQRLACLACNERMSGNWRPEGAAPEPPREPEFKFPVAPGNTILAYRIATGDDPPPGPGWSLLAELQATVGATPAEPGLDVERLARAIKARMDIGPMRWGSFDGVDVLDYADAIAAEYAALSESGKGGTP